MASGFAQASNDIAKRLMILESGLAGKDRAAAMMRLGRAAQQDHLKAARADLGGDNKFSGWARAPLNTELDQAKLNAGQVTVRPTGRARGPYRVAESGRGASGATGGFQGPSINRKTGTTFRTKKRGNVSMRQSGARVKRWSGTTAGKNTWTDGVQIVARETPDRLRKEIRKTLVKAVRGR